MRQSQKRARQTLPFLILPTPVPQHVFISFSIPDEAKNGVATSKKRQRQASPFSDTVEIFNCKQQIPRSKMAMVLNSSVLSPN